MFTNVIQVSRKVSKINGALIKGTSTGLAPDKTAWPTFSWAIDTSSGTVPICEYYQLFTIFELPLSSKSNFLKKLFIKHCPSIKNLDTFLYLLYRYFYILEKKNNFKYFTSSWTNYERFFSLSLLIRLIQYE